MPPIINFSNDYMLPLIVFWVKVTDISTIMTKET
jgi:hypothetical protein